VNFVEGRDAIVPLEESGGVADALDGAIVKFPYWIDDWMIVSIENVLAIFGVAGDVDLSYAIGSYTVDVSGGIETVILRRDVNVVDVEKNAAVGLLDNLVEEFPFSHFGDVIFGVAGNVFDHDRNLDIIADFADFLRGDASGLERVRHRKKVVGVAAIHAAPAEVVGEPRSFGATNEILEAAKVFAI